MDWMVRKGVRRETIAESGRVRVNPYLYPTLWRTCRVLSNPRRLRVFLAVCAAGRAGVNQIRDLCRIPQPTASQYLRQLQARGLLQARPAGRQVIYLPQADPAVGHARSLGAAMLRAQQRGESPAGVRRGLQALTHARRIAILRALHAAPGSRAEVGARCRIPPAAVARHLRHLEIRRVICRDARGRYRLNRKMPSLCRTLVRLVTAP